MVSVSLIALSNMDFFDKLTTRAKIICLCLLAAVNLVVFVNIFGFHTNNDTEGFISAINFFRGEQVELSPNRYLNPFYPLVGSTVLKGVTPEMNIIILNILFYFGLALLTYGLIKRVFNDRVGFMTSSVVITAYPMLRYGLTQVQDVGGYFWFVLSFYAGWRWFEDKRWQWLVVGGVAVSFGMLTKESGAMGALFIGAVILLSQLELKKKLLAIGTSAVLPVLTLFINQSRGNEVGYNSLQWFIDNWKVYAPTNYNFIKFAGVNASTYNIVWIFFVAGVYFVLRNWATTPKNLKIYLAAALIPSLSFLAWPIFISRTVFISAWLIIPLAMYGLTLLADKSKYSQKIIIGSMVVILVTPYLLQSTLRYAHVFQILDICHRSIGCSWDYFWYNRESFSKTL